MRERFYHIADAKGSIFSVISNLSMYESDPTVAHVALSRMLAEARENSREYGIDDPSRLIACENYKEVSA